MAGRQAPAPGNPCPDIAGGIVLYLAGVKADREEREARQRAWKREEELRALARVPPLPGTFVVNIGDQMARWTNGAFVSTFHRVYNAFGRARYSIPTFVGANADAVIQALPSCVSENNPPKFEPVVAGEYVTGLIYQSIHKISYPKITNS